MILHDEFIKKIENEFIFPNKIVPLEMDLTYNELKILHYLQPICNKDFSLPMYLSEYIEDAESLVRNGFLGEAELSVFLEKKCVQELKEFLKSIGLPHSGLKKDIIKRIVDKADHNKVIDHFKINNYYTITQKGKDTIKKYPRIILDDMELIYITDSIYQYMTKDILIENIDFAQSNIRFIDKYKDYDLSIKAFILALEKDIESRKLTTNPLNKQKMFEKLYNVIISENVFEQVRRYLYSLRELKRTPIDENIISKYTIESMTDERVCKHCKTLQGKTFLIKDAKIGINYPPFYECKSNFCRCFAAIDFDIV